MEKNEPLMESNPLEKLALEPFGRSPQDVEMMCYEYINLAPYWIIQSSFSILHSLFIPFGPACSEFGQTDAYHNQNKGTLSLAKRLVLSPLEWST